MCQCRKPRSLRGAIFRTLHAGERRSRFGAALFALLLAAAFTPPASAQELYDRVARDRKSDSLKDFKLTLTLPFLYNTSVLASNSDGETIDKEDWHFYPDLELKWVHQFTGFRMTAYGAVGTDRYDDVRSADVSALEGGLIAEWTDGKSDLFIPYVSVIGRSYYDRDFESLDDRRTDLAIGVFSGVGWRDGKAIRYTEALKAGDQSLGLDVQAGRRVANESHRENAFTTAALDYTYNFTSNFWVVAGPKLRVRWYDDFFDEFRRDVRFSFRVKAMWQPKWLTDMLPHSELTFGVEYYNNSSTDEFSDYTIWELGPSLKLSTHF
jgi:hypothetical protein